MAQHGKPLPGLKPLLILTVAFLLGACSGPFFYFPGGALAGPEQPYGADAVPTGDTLIQLETRPSEPYSVNLNAVVMDGALYLDPTEERAWYQHIVADNRIRIRIDGADTVYTAKATIMQDPVVTGKFDADRIPLRIDPR